MRESRTLGSVRAKPNGCATRPGCGLSLRVEAAAKKYTALFTASLLNRRFQDRRQRLRGDRGIETPAGQVRTLLTLISRDRFFYGPRRRMPVSPEYSLRTADVELTQGSQKAVQPHL